MFRIDVESLVVIAFKRDPIAFTASILIERSATEDILDELPLRFRDDLGRDRY